MASDTSAPAPETSAALRRTPLYDEHVALHARIVPFAGWEMPVQYSGIVDEHHAVRRAVGLFDVSHMGELLIEGPKALAAVSSLVTNDVESLTDGCAKYTLCCNEQGTVLDDLIVYRVGRERVLVVCNASNREKIVGHFVRSLEGRAGVSSVRDISDETALIAVQGPKAFELLRAAGADGRVSELPAFCFVDSTLCNAPCTVARTGYTGEDGVELFCRPDDAAKIWRTLLSLGADLGAKPAGLGCRDTLRLECKMSLYGNEIDETTNPIEAGLAWTVKLEKGDFVGRDAIARVVREGVARKLVGFEMKDRAIARHGWQVVGSDGAAVEGVVTSGAPSPTLQKNIGLAYVPLAKAAVGSEITLRDPQRGRTATAVVVKTPFYKRAK